MKMASHVLIEGFEALTCAENIAHVHVQCLIAIARLSLNCRHRQYAANINKAEGMFQQILKM